jgi:toxin ParE1/3/4
MQETFQWYEGRQEGLGDDFTAEVENALNRLLISPTSYGIVFHGMRRMAVKRFPYGIYYLVRGELILIVAVFHSRRNLARLRKRLRGR